MLFWIHPIVQLLTILLAVYVLWLGWARFASRHLGKQTVFQWNEHVRLGKVAVVVLSLGALGGTFVTYITYGRIFTESLHFRIGMAMLVLLGITWATGTRMDKHRNQSATLAIVHAVNNTLLLILILVQLITGIGIVRSVLLS